MYNNGLVDLHHQVQAQLWVNKLNEAHERGQLCAWVSTSHPERLGCALEGTFHHGSFNAGVKMVFSDGSAWMVRFPRVGKVHNDYADEKVAMEVRTLNLIRERTTIPVPKIQAWGYAADNSLGLGAFMMMDFLDGVDGDIEVIYRHFANFLLQLFSLDFDSIGSLPSLEAKPDSPVQKHPLTYKAHDILHNGGIDVFGDRLQGFATTTEYFQYLLGQNFAKKDLTVVGVVDLEWSYIGPAQLFGSAPWWLLQDRPINEEWEWQDSKPPKLAERYFKYLDIYKRELEEEEAKMPGHEERELSKLVEWSQESGAMWLHMLISVGFNDHRSFPFTQLRQHVGEKKWERRKAEFVTLPEGEAFVTQKTLGLEEYELAKDKLESDKALVDAGQMTLEAFLATSVGPG